LQLLSGEIRARIEPLMPVASAKGGRPFRDQRVVVEGIIWRYRTGSPWRDLPESFGAWKTAWRRHDQYCEDGTWNAILAAVLTEAADGDLIDCAVSVDSTINRAHQDGTNLPSGTARSGMPLVVLRGPGQARDATMFPILMGHLPVAARGPGRPRTRADRVRGDKAPSSKAIRELLRSSGIQAVIPQPGLS
jgi:transposase